MAISTTPIEPVPRQLRGALSATNLRDLVSQKSRASLISFQAARLVGYPRPCIFALPTYHSGGLWACSSCIQSHLPIQNTWLFSQARDNALSTSRRGFCVMVQALGTPLHNLPQNNPD